MVTCSLARGCGLVLVLAGLVGALTSCGGTSPKGLTSEFDSGSLFDASGASSSGGSSSGGFAGDDGSSVFSDTGSTILAGEGGGCIPKTCSDLGYDCGANEDGCGGSIDCGTCTSPAYCGGGGSVSADPGRRMRTVAMPRRSSVFRRRAPLRATSAARTGTAAGVHSTVEAAPRPRRAAAAASASAA